MALFISLIVHVLVAISMLFFGSEPAAYRSSWVDLTVNTHFLVETVCGPWSTSQIVTYPDGSWQCDAT